MSYLCDSERYGEEHEIFRHAVKRFPEEGVKRQLTVFARGTVEMAA